MSKDILSARLKIGSIFLIANEQGMIVLESPFRHAIDMDPQTPREQKFPLPRNSILCVSLACIERKHSPRSLPVALPRGSPTSSLTLALGEISIPHPPHHRI